MTRRDAMQTLATAAGAAALTATPRVVRAAETSGQIRVDLTPLHQLSPYLFMQFMEPLGTTDGSVEAAWNHVEQDWRQDVIDATRRLAPTMVRWGGIFTDFYRWREGVGPRDQRRPMVNLMWGGLESNQVGTDEFLDFCRRVEAEPLMCVNFEGDGRQNFRTVHGQERWADAAEAAEWVRFCNDPDDPQRRKVGRPAPAPIRYWQLGNETSYDARGFDRDTAIAKTIEFSHAMRKVDPTIRIIAWGDSGWAPAMIDRAGEHLDLVAFHHMFNPDRQDHPVLQGDLYRRDPAAAWDCLMAAWEHSDRKIREVRDSLDGRQKPLAMTECHFAIPGRDRCDVMSTWATGVAYARILNNFQRHGDVLKIATAADFCGTRWQVNALMIPVPYGRPYLQPVARVMQLYRRHTGEHAVQATGVEGLDVAASRTEQTLHLNVVNVNRSRPVRAKLSLVEGGVQSATAYVMADDPTTEVTELNDESVMQITKREWASTEAWEFPAASVTAIDVTLAA